MGDEIIGYSDEGCCEPLGAARYELDTIYKAVANTSKSVYRTYFLFSYSHGSGKCVNVGECIDGLSWNVYHIGTATEVHHTCPEGTWILRIHVGCQPDWLFKDREGYLHSATISLANAETTRHHYGMPVDPETLAQKNYREMKAEDERKKVMEWYEKAKKEVKGEMYLQLIDVTIFNRETKHIDFRENIVAENNDEAYLLAVQAFGKYNPKVHVKAARCILGFNEIGDKEEG